MSQTEASFKALRGAIQSLWSGDEERNIAITDEPGMLVLKLPNDVAAFSVFNSHPNEVFQRTYDGFKQIYRQNNREWDQRTLSFVLCRSSEEEKDDAFYASLEQDPLFCRKYVIRSLTDADSQRDELLRLPFLPLRGSDGGSLQRPQSAQDLLQGAGFSASLARNLVEAGVRSPERIAADLREGKEQLPSAIVAPRPGHLTLSRPRARSRLVSLTVDGFRVYREERKFWLDAPVVVLYGPNGLGKTSVFDAIDYACTGRIGRLNQRRSPSEFARLATHLDKAPGSGIVKAEVRGEGGNESAIWKLERSTGDWSNALIDGSKADRKSVISKLTQANWLDSAPRQQAYENLFRATHLFGQDEDELLSAFKRESVIPEAFISEMLALQDYSQGISKAAAVVSRLNDYRGEVEHDLEMLRSEAKALDGSIAELGPVEGETDPTPIENVLEDLRNDLVKLRLNENLPPDSPTISTFSEWQEVLSGEGKVTEDLISEVQQLEVEIPDYRRFQEASTNIQDRLKQIEIELASTTAAELDAVAGLEANAAVIAEAESRRQLQEKRRQNLRAAAEARRRLDEISKEITALTRERDRQMLDWSEADVRFAVVEAALSAATSSVSEAAHSSSSINSEIVKIKGLLSDFGKFESDRESSASIQDRLDEARNHLQDTETRQRRAEAELRAATSAREAARPAYERALAQQAELDKLLDSLQSHVLDSSCPLCGSKFESVNALLTEIGKRRSAAQNASNVTVGFKLLEAQEAKANDALRVIVADIKATTTATQELSALQNSTNTRLQQFRERLLSALPHADEGIARTALETALGDLQTRKTDSEQALAEANARLQAVQLSRAEELLRRKTISERIVSLERNVHEYSDRMTTLEARLSQAGEDGENLATLDEAIARAERAIQEAVLAVEQLLAVRTEQSGKRAALAHQKAAIEERRRASVSELSGVQRSITSFELRLKKFDLATLTVGTLVSVRERLDRRAEGIRCALDRAVVVLSALNARERRLQLAEKRTQLDALRSQITQRDADLRRVKDGASVLVSAEHLLKNERQGSIKRHIEAYGPMIARIQQRLRSVYGFGGVKLEVQGGETKVRVDWRNRKDIHVQPTDFFSDSQRQILMLSIFLAGGLRQTWSGFAPVLLDDPVTHFDDLNAYGFIEMIRGIVSTTPHAWQFVISTCEERLFNLMLRKFSPANAIFYQFKAMSEDGPIVERR
jgi:exonuclease SbcC